MFPEPGGSMTMARYGFNELAGFIAGWAILIDYVIVIALAAITVPHYLSPISESISDSGGEVATAGLVIALVAAINVRDHRPTPAGGLVVLSSPTSR